MPTLGQAGMLHRLAALPTHEVWIAHRQNKGTWWHYEDMLQVRPIGYGPPIPITRDSLWYYIHHIWYQKAQRKQRRKS